MRLDPADVQAIAERVAELLATEPPGQDGRVRYLDATQLAWVLGVEREWVYIHAQQLGAIRLSGTKGRLRFDLQHVQRTLAAPNQEAPPPVRRPACSGRRRRQPKGLDLLPYES